MKRLSRCLLLIYFALMVSSCFIDGEITDIGIGFFITLGSVVILLIYAFIKDSIDDEKRKIEEQKQLELNKKEDDSILSELSQKYGKPETVIKFSDNRIKTSFMVFENAQSIYACSQFIPFSQIDNCEIIDESGTRYHLTSDAVIGSNGSVVGRSVAGGLIAGPTGAIIGGLSANTNKPTSYKTTTHHYFAIINLKSLTNPILRIDCGENSREKAEQVRAIVMNIASNYNKLSSMSIADELNKLLLLKEQGILTQEEFEQQKKKLL